MAVVGMVHVAQSANLQQYLDLLNDRDCSIYYEDSDKNVRLDYDEVDFYDGDLYNDANFESF